MLRLLAVLACEKIIIDKGKTPSIISVLQTAAVTLPPGTPAELPPNAVLPQPWAIFTAWDHDAEDVGKTFRQRNATILPDQTIGTHFSGELSFVVKEDGLIFNFVNIYGFPAGLEGRLTVKVWLEAEDGKMVSPEYYYPIIVKHPTGPQSEATVKS